MPTLQEEIEQAVVDITAARDVIEDDTDTLHAIVHGPAEGPTSTVTTDGGEVLTAARAIAEMGEIGLVLLGNLDANGNALIGGEALPDTLTLYSSTAENEDPDAREGDAIIFMGSSKHFADDDNFSPYEYARITTSGLELNRTRVLVHSRTADVGGTEMRLIADHAYPQAVTNVGGGALRLAGGLGVRKIEITSYASISTSSFHFRVNSGLTKLTAGTDFSAVTNNGTTAQNLLDAIIAADLTGFTPTGVRVGQVLYIQPHPHNFEFDVYFDGSGATVTREDDGAVQLGNNSTVTMQRIGLDSNSLWTVGVLETQRFGVAAGNGFGPILNFAFRNIDGDTFGSQNIIGGISTFRQGGDTTGTMRIAPRLAGSATAAAVNFSTSSVSPNVSDALTCGASSALWDIIYSSTGTINTSDARLKQQVREFSDAELRALRKIAFSVYKFNAAVQKKGAEARLHMGVIGQQVIEAYTSEGLDAFEYGAVGGDLIYENVTTTEERTHIDPVTNVPVTEQVEIETREPKLDQDGNHLFQLSVRYEELLVGIVAAMTQRLDDLETRLAALESA